MPDGYTLWCQERGCTHAHCPRHCEHPQPIRADDGRLFCGRCWFRSGELSEMMPCDPATCPD